MTSEKTEQGSNASAVKYEDYRKRRIQENMQKMHEMGITNISIGTPARKPSKRTPTKASNLSPGSQSSFPPRRSSRLQKISPVNYSEHPNEKKSMGERVLTDEGLVPEVYTEEHEKLLGSCQNAWVLFQDGYDGRDGKRIYDPLNGKTCHQCRQKTLGHRTSCSKCNLVQGQFCGDCLYTRYGENVLEVNRTPEWICPVCRGICNCSMCRIKKGWLPTGILYRKITRLGYKSVAHYLIQTHRFDAKNEGNHEKIDESTSKGSLNFSDADQTDMENKLSSAVVESCQNPEDLIGQQKEPSDLEAKGQSDSSPAASTGLSKQQREASMTAIPDTDHGSENKYPSDLASSLDNSGPHQNAIVESLQSGREIGIVDCDINGSPKGYTKEGEVNASDAFSPTTPENFNRPKNRNKNYSERTTVIPDSVVGRIKRRCVGMIQFCRA